MLLIAIVLLVLTAAIVIGVVAGGNDESVTLQAPLGLSLDLSIAGVFFAGVVTVAVAVLGLWLLKAGAARGYRRRKQMRDLRQQAAASPAPARHPESGPAERRPAPAAGDQPPGTAPKGGEERR